MTVFLVGAGPGDPGLITVRGAEVLGRAGAVVYDRLSAPELLDLAPDTSERHFVGKRPDAGSKAQSEINELLVSLAERHDVVVRLKGGDPFVFARGGEEATALAAAGVHFEVVPGISSAVAVPAYAGIPVTMRYASTSVTVVTGHEDPTTAGTVDWRAIARVGGTIVILMGVARIGAIVAELLEGGLPAGTPAAAIRWGTRPGQVTVRTSLGELPGLPLEAPSVIVVGDVAAQDLRWFERRPLFGRSVVVTRTRLQASALSGRLRELGADVVELPTIALADPTDAGAALRDAARRVGEFDWLVLTSPNGVDRFCRELHDGRDLAGVRLAAIGTGTAAALDRWHLRADLLPQRFVAESLLDAMPDPPPGGGRVLLARAEVARDVLPDGLAARGWDVEIVDAYRTVGAPVDPTALARAAASDIITFTSSSTVTRFLEIAGADRLPPAVAAIGPITAATARAAGIVVDSVAVEHSIDGLVAAVTELAGRRAGSPDGDLA